MSLKGALYQYLTGVSDVTDLVGTDIYRGTVPGDVAQPYAVYHVISDVPAHHQDGASGLTEARLQFNVYADDDEEADAIALALREALDGLPRAERGTGDEATTIDSCRLENAPDGFIPPGFASDEGTFQRMLDFIVWYRQTVPSF